MFKMFENQESRRKYGSAFVELAFCKLDNKATIKKKLQIKKLPNWQNDSLYVHVDDLDVFYGAYNKVFGINYEQLFDVTYFPKENIGEIIERLNSEKQKEYQILVDWLNSARIYNGFYILGI